MDFSAPGQHPSSGEYKWETQYPCNPTYHHHTDPNPHGIISLPQGQYIMTCESGDKRCVSTHAGLYSKLAFENLRKCLGSDTPVGAILSLTYKSPVTRYAVFGKDQSTYRVCEEINGQVRGSIWYKVNRH